MKRVFSMLELRKMADAINGLGGTEFSRDFYRDLYEKIWLLHDLLEAEDKLEKVTK